MLDHHCKLYVLSMKSIVLDPQAFGVLLSTLLLLLQNIMDSIYNLNIANKDDKYIHVPNEYIVHNILVDMNGIIIGVLYNFCLLIL